MIQELQNKLFNEIPLTKIMNIHIKEYNNKHLLTFAPLDININDKGTAFGGSLSTMTIISSWGLAYLLTKKLGFENRNIMIIKNETSFNSPVTKDILCYTYEPNHEEIEILKNKLLNKGSGSIKIHSQIIENEKICVDFSGYYVIQLLNN